MGDAPKDFVAPKCLLKRRLTGYYCYFILRKIIKFVATIRCQILRVKCTKFNFGWGSAPDPAGGAYSALPDFILLSEQKETGTEGEVGEEEQR